MKLVTMALDSADLEDKYKVSLNSYMGTSGSFVKFPKQSGGLQQLKEKGLKSDFLDLSAISAI